MTPTPAPLPASCPLARSIPSLTGIRGIAALWVAAFHAITIFDLQATPLTRPLEHGWSGVDLFFVLSGFILMHAHGEEFRNINHVILRNYVWRRFLKVYPLNLVVLIAIVTLLAVDHGFATRPGGLFTVTAHETATSSMHYFWEAFFATATLMTVWGPVDMTLNQPVWSLSAEVMAYTAFPVLAWCLMRLKGSVALIALGSFVAMVALRTSLGQAHFNQLATGGALVRVAGCFVCGAAFWRLRTILPARWAKFAAPLAGLSVIGIVICSISFRLGEALPLLYGLLIIALSYQQGHVDRVLSIGVSHFLGAVSFPFYLVHVIIMVWLAWFFSTYSYSARLCLATIAIGTSLAVASALHWLIEIPAQRFGRKAKRKPMEAMLITANCKGSIS